MIKSCYIHIPFCKNICKYCDFCKMYYNTSLTIKYLKSLEKEININYKKEVLNTIYIGGGTPSCLNIKELKLLFKTIDKLKLNKKYEFTFECNIEDITERKLKFLKDKRVNRLSIGVQSFNKEILSFLGRKNINITKKINLAKKYFDNINIDLIYSINGFSIEDLKKDLTKYLQLDLKHISIYSLILEDNTILKINNYKEIEDDISRDMYDYICKTLKHNGYKHIEISNFSKKGYESKHNLTYWNNDKYYGFGLGASGYIDNIRYTNTRNINSYINGKYKSIEETITKDIDMSNEMILGLRKIKGVSNKKFYKKYGLNIEDVFDTHLLKKNKDYYYIDKNNLYISNYILKDFIF